MLANAVKCPICNGAGEFKTLAGIRPTEMCFRCAGTGLVYSDCHKPEGVCECVKSEPCPKCGKVACRCEP